MVRNKVLALGERELPVLIDANLDKLYNIDEFAPGFVDKYMKKTKKKTQR